MAITQAVSTFTVGNTSPHSNPWPRQFYINVLAGYEYEVAVLGGSGALPTAINFGYTDTNPPAVPACFEAASLSFPSGITVTEV